jgi:hypothetical protein
MMTMLDMTKKNPPAAVSAEQLAAVEMCAGPWRTACP